MPLNRSGVFACAVAAVAGCALLRPLEMPAQTGTAEIFVDEATFDGRWLTARVLLRSRGGDLAVQQHLAPNQGLSIEAVKECESGAAVPFLEFTAAGTDEDPLIRVLDGHWFGVDARFAVYDESIIGRAVPDCIEVTIAWWIPGDPKTARAVRTSIRVTKRADQPDAGARNDAG